MTWVWATLLLLLVAPWVLWPLVRHWQPAVARPRHPDPADERLRALEEIELDLEAGRLSEEEAALRRREL